jgi:hypothetical protein
MGESERKGGEAHLARQVVYPALKGRATKAQSPSGAEERAEGKRLGTEGDGDAAPTLVEDVGVDHGGADISMAEQFLNGATTIAVEIKGVAKDWRRIWQFPALEKPTYPTNMKPAGFLQAKAPLPGAEGTAHQSEKGFDGFHVVGSPNPRRLIRAYECGVFFRSGFS